VKTEYTEQILYVLKLVILFVAEYGSAPWEDEGGKALRFACTNKEATVIQVILAGKPEKILATNFRLPAH